MERYIKQDGFIYDAEEQLDLGLEETTDLLNFLYKENKKLREKIDEQDRKIEGLEHQVFVGYDLY